MKLGETIKKIRKEKGITQKKLAALTGFTQSYLSQIEATEKQPSLSTIEIIAKALDVPIPALIWLSMDTSDVATNKLAVYEKLKPGIDKLIEKLL